MAMEQHESGQNYLEVEIDILEFSERGEEVPHARWYWVTIDGAKYRIDSPTPTGVALLALVGTRPCAFELIEEFVHHENRVVEAEEAVDLREKGLKGFITAHKEIVTIFIDGDPYPIERGERTKTPEGYMLLEEKSGPPEPAPSDLPIKILGCEVFHTQTQSGGSSHP